MQRIIPGRDCEGSFPTEDANEPLVGIAVGSGGEIQQIIRVGAEKIVYGPALLVRHKGGNGGGVVAGRLDAHEDQVTGMAGVVGGGGLGNIAIQYGYYRNKLDVMYAAVIILIVIVQVLQMIGTAVSKKLDKRITD